MKKKMAVCALAACMVLQGSISCEAEDGFIQDKMHLEEEGNSEEIVLDDTEVEETDAVTEAFSEVFSEIEPPEDGEEFLLDPETESLEESRTESISEEWGDTGSGNIVASEDNGKKEWVLDSDGVLIIRGNGDTSGTYSKYAGQIKHVIIEKGISGITDWCFNGGMYGYSNLIDITIPDSVKSIGMRAFLKGISLERVAMPADSVVSIGEYAFAGCENLTDITIPDSVTSIGEAAFDQCKSLTDITVPDGVRQINKFVFEICESLKKVTLPDNLISIGEGAFRFCRSLTDITIPDSVTSIGDDAFLACSSLRKISLPDGVTSIGKGAFSNCESLDSINIPNGVTTIGENTFMLCISLKRIILPDSVTSIGESAFSACKNLESVDIPNSVTSIGERAFAYNALKSVRIPDSVTDIGKEAFLECISMTDITIPADVQIGSDAFKNCPNLTIYGYTGSPAETYAKENQIPFVDLNVHIYDEGKVTKEPTFTETGIRTYTCTICGITREEIIPTVCKHEWSGWVTVSKSTVFTAEMQRRNCILCGEEETRTVGKTLIPTVKLNVSNVVLKVNQSTDKVTVSGLASGDKVDTWSSNNTVIVKVDSKTGKLMAQNKTGTAKVTVKLTSGKTADLTVKVQNTAVKTTKIAGLSSKAVLAKGKTLILNPILEPITSLEKVSYTTSNKKVATVNSKGVITAKAAGTAKITVKAGSKKNTITVTVPKTTTAKIENVPEEITLKKNKTYMLKPELNPKGSDEKITYTSSNKRVVSVSASGKITAKSKGTAVITVKSGKIVRKCKVQVN